MEILTSELTGAALNWAVCRAQHPDADMSAMRCYVASKLGNTVDIPDELANEGEIK